MKRIILYFTEDITASSVSKILHIKSEHDKRVLQRNSRKDFAVFFERTGKRIGRI